MRGIAGICQSFDLAMMHFRQVFLIRHPKPEIAPGICYGGSDIPPAPAALQSAVEWLDSVLPDNAQMISSPLARCAQLASQLSTRKQRSYILEPRFAERCCGAWELQSWEQVPRAELDAWAADFMDYSAPGAESVRQLQTRVLAAWTEHTRQTEQRTLVLLTHAGPIQILLAHLTGALLSAKPLVEIGCGAAVLLTQAHSNVDRWDVRVISSSY